MTSTTRPTAAQPHDFQTLWLDKSNVIYCFGGQIWFDTAAAANFSTPEDSIWAFTPDRTGSGNWTEALGPAGSAPFPQGIFRPAEGASASDGNKGYYLAGYVTSDTSPEIHLLGGQTRPSPGLLTFDYSSMTITNTSDGGYFASQYADSNATVAGVMIDVPPFGEDGVLIVMGGQSGLFDNLTIYDKRNQLWYSQTAGGDIPTARGLFCATGVQGGDSSSYEIFMHGGIQNNFQGTANSGGDEIFILTLPAFQWVQVNYTSVSPRAYHTCHAAGNSQMVIVGGIDGTASFGTLFNGSADPWPQAIGVFDMSALEWKDSYEANAAPYVPAPVIESFYGSNAGKYPPQWTSPAVEQLFHPTPNTTVPTSSSTPIPSPTPAAHQLSHGAIAGMVIGCIGVVILPWSVIAFFLWRRRQHQKLALPPKDGIFIGSPTHPRKLQGFYAAEMEGSYQPRPLEKSHSWELSTGDVAWEMERTTRVFKPAIPPEPVELG